MPAVSHLPSLQTGFQGPLSPELALVLACAGPRPDGQGSAGVVAALARGPDWARVLRLAEWHRMLPLVCRQLGALGWRSVPDGVVDALREFSRLNAAESLRRASELVALLRALEAAGIPALPYKGPALAAQLYGNVALRHAGDLDVLVRRGDALRARALLLSRGYCLRHQVDASATTFMLRSRYCDTLDRADGLTVELHWAFTNGDVNFALALDELLPRARTVRLGGQDVRVFGDEDQLLVLGVHGAKHRWSRIEWLCAFAALIRSAPGVDWTRVAARARALRVERRLLLGIRLAAETFGAPVPAEVYELARAARQVRMLADEVRDALWEQPGRTPGFEQAMSIPSDWFHLRLSDGLRDRLRLLSYRATTPSRPERWAAVSVGRRTVAVHALLHPLEVGVQFMPALWSHLRQRRASS